VPALLEQLAERSWSLRRLVVAALAGLGDVAVGPVCELLRTQRQNESRIAAAVDVLAASTGSTVDQAVLALTESRDPAIIADAAQILGRRRSSAAIPTLSALTLHRDDNVAVAAIEALGRIGGRAAVDPLIASAQSGSFFRTFPAIDVLGRSGDPRAVAPLTALLEDSRYAYEAARALGHTGDKAAVAPLTKLLARPSDMMVRLAATAIAELYDTHAERYGVTGALDQALRASSPATATYRLTRAITGASPVEQVAICRLLGELGDDSAVPSLMRLLDALTPAAAAAAEALKKLGRKANADLLEALRDGDSPRRQVLLPLISPRSSAIPDVIQCLTDREAVVRSMACDALARIGNPAAVPSIFPLLADPNVRVVQAAVGAIQSLGSAETEALTLEAARSSSPQVRRAALRIIAYFGYRSALEVLLDAIRGADERLREGAIAGLPFLEHPKAMEALASAASHESPRARAAAMRALGQCQAEPSVTASLHAGLKDADPWVRYYACQSLGKLAWEDAAGPVAALLEDEAGQVRVAAMEALSHMRGDAAFDALRKAVDATDVDMRRAALIGLGIRKHRAALPILLSAASSPEPATRLVAVSAIAGFDAPEVVPALGQAVADRDDSVRTAALGFLAARPTVEATLALIDRLRAGAYDPRILAALSIASEGRIQGILTALEAADDELSPRLTSALARMHNPNATAVLLSALSMPSAPARKAAAATLGAIGTQEAMEQLRRASTDDPDPEVRRICALALSH
jgi:HEAT repeat protein